MKKKFTMLFAALLACVGVVKAQHWLQPTVSTETETYEYYIANYRDGDYYVTTTTGLNGGAQQLGSANAFDETKAKVTFKLVEGGKLWSTNTTTPLILGYTTTSEAANSVQLFAADSQEGYTWKIESANGGNTLSAGASDNSWNMHGGKGNNIGLYRKSDAGSNWVFVPANDAAVAKANEAKAEFEISTEYYYQIKNVAYSRMLAANTNDKATTISTNSTGDLNQLWAFEAGENGTFYLRNAGQQKYLVATTTGNTAWTVGAEGSAFEVDILNFSNKTWAIHATGQDQYGFAHDANWDKEEQVVRWLASASASQWYLEKTEISTTAKEISFTYSFVYEGEEKFTQSCFGIVGEAYPEIAMVLPYGVSSEAKPSGELSADVEDTKVEINLTIEKELPFETAANANSITTWYYTKMHTNQPGYLGDIADDKTINVAKGKSFDAYSDNYVWGFVGNVFDGITVVNKGTGLQLTSAGSGNVTLTENGTPFFVARTSETSANATNGFCLRRSDSNQYLNANYTASKLSHWSSTDAGSTFFLTEYEETAVTVSDVDWATMYLGYAVYIPEGVNAYTVTGVESGYVTLTQLEGVIPANTGVLLENAGEYTFKKAAKDPAAIAENLLRGSVANTYVEGTAYVLSAKNGVGLYKATLNKNAEGGEGDTHFLNNAGKAYLVLPAEAEAPAMFSFGRGEGTTGIDNAQLAIDDVAIYDLAGRRVQTMEKGIYIVNGKKVIR